MVHVEVIIGFENDNMMYNLSQSINPNHSIVSTLSALTLDISLNFRMPYTPPCCTSCLLLTFHIASYGNVEVAVISQEEGVGKSCIMHRVSNKKCFNIPGFWMFYWNNE